MRVLRGIGLWRVVVALVAILVVVGLAVVDSAGDEAVAPPALPGEAALSARPSTTFASDGHVSYLVGSEFVQGSSGRRGRIGGGDDVIAALSGSLVPVAVESSDGSVVAYQTWRQPSQPDHTRPGQGLETGQSVGMTSVRLFKPEQGITSLWRRALTRRLSQRRTGSPSCESETLSCGRTSPTVDTSWWARRTGRPSRVGRRSPPGTSRTLERETHSLSTGDNRGRRRPTSTHT